MKPPVGSRVNFNGQTGTVKAHRPGSMVDVRWDDRDYDMRTDASSLTIVRSNPGPRGGLTPRERERLPDYAFALPGRRFPINDANHGRIALQYILAGRVAERDVNNVVNAVLARWGDNREVRAFYEKHKKKLTRANVEKTHHRRVAANPEGDVYDPAKEQFRSVVQGVYESLVRKELGKKYDEPFVRNPRGRRLDDSLSEDRKRELLSRAYAIATRQGQKYGWLEHGTQKPTERGAARSRQRLIERKHAEENRQDYEETLSAVRKSGRYRVVEEVIDGRNVFVVQPRPPEGLRIPKYRLRREAAEADAAAAARSFRKNPYYVIDRDYSMETVDIPDEPEDVTIAENETFVTAAKKLGVAPEFLYQHGEAERPSRDPRTGVTKFVEAPGRLRKVRAPSRKEKRKVIDEEATAAAQEAANQAFLRDQAEYFAARKAFEEAARKGLRGAHPPTPPQVKPVKTVYKIVEVQIPGGFREGEDYYSGEDLIDPLIEGFRIPKRSIVESFEKGYVIEDMAAAPKSPERFKNLAKRQVDEVSTIRVPPGMTWAEAQRKFGISDTMLDVVWDNLPKKLTAEYYDLLSKARKDSAAEKTGPYGFVVPFPGVDVVKWWGDNGLAFRSELRTLISLLEGKTLSRDKAEKFAIRTSPTEVIPWTEEMETRPDPEERKAVLRRVIAQLEMPQGFARALFGSEHGLAEVAYWPRFNYDNFLAGLRQLESHQTAQQAVISLRQGDERTFTQGQKRAAENARTRAQRDRYELARRIALSQPVGRETISFKTGRKVDEPYESLLRAKKFRTKAEQLEYMRSREPQIAKAKIEGEKLLEAQRAAAEQFRKTYKPAAHPEAPQQREEVVYFDEEEVSNLLATYRVQEEEYQKALRGLRGSSGATESDDEDELEGLAVIDIGRGEGGARERGAERIHRSAQQALEALIITERQLLDAYPGFRPRYLRRETSPSQPTKTKTEQVRAAKETLVRSVVDEEYQRQRPSKKALQDYVQENRPGSATHPGGAVIYPASGNSPFQYALIDLSLSTQERNQLAAQGLRAPALVADSFTPVLTPVPKKLTEGRIPWIVLVAAADAPSKEGQQKDIENPSKLGLYKDPFLNTVAGQAALRAAAKAYEEREPIKAREWFPNLYRSLEKPLELPGPLVILFKREPKEVWEATTVENRGPVEKFIADQVRALVGQAQKDGKLAPVHTLARRPGNPYLLDGIRPTPAGNSGLEPATGILEIAKMPESQFSLAPLAGRARSGRLLSVGAEAFSARMAAIADAASKAQDKVTFDLAREIEEQQVFNTPQRRSILDRAGGQPESSEWQAAKADVNARRTQIDPAARDPFNGDRYNELRAAWKYLSGVLSETYTQLIPEGRARPTVKGVDFIQVLVDARDASSLPELENAINTLILAMRSPDAVDYGATADEIKVGEAKRIQDALRIMLELTLVGLEAVYAEAVRRMEASASRPRGEPLPFTTEREDRIKEIRSFLNRIQGANPRMPAAEDRPPEAFWDVEYDERSPIKEAYTIYIDRHKFRVPEFEREKSGAVKVYDTTTRRVVRRTGPDTSGVPAGPTSEELALAEQRDRAAERGDKKAEQAARSKLTDLARQRRLFRAKTGSSPFVSPYRVIGYTSGLKEIQRHLAKFARPVAARAESDAVKQVEQLSRGAARLTLEELASRATLVSPTARSAPASESQAEAAYEGDPRNGWAIDRRWTGGQIRASTEFGVGGVTAQHRFSLSNYVKFKTYDPQVAAATILYWNSPSLVTGAVIELPHGKTLITPSGWTSTAGDDPYLQEQEARRVLPHNVLATIAREIEAVSWEAEQAAKAGRMDVVNQAGDILFGIVLPGGTRVPGLKDAYELIASRTAFTLPARTEVRDPSGQRMFGGKFTIEGAERISLEGMLKGLEPQRAAADTAVKRLLTINALQELAEARTELERKALEHAQAVGHEDYAAATKVRGNPAHGPQPFNSGGRRATINKNGTYRNRIYNSSRLMPLVFE